MKSNPFTILVSLFLIPFCGWSATIETVLGTGEAGFSGDGGPATEAKCAGHSEWCVAQMAAYMYVIPTTTACGKLMPMEL